MQTWYLQGFSHRCLLHQMPSSQLVPAGTSLRVRLRERFLPRRGRPALHGLHTWVIQTLAKTQTLEHVISYKHSYTVGSWFHTMLCIQCFHCSQIFAFGYTMALSNNDWITCYLISLQCIPVRIYIAWLLSIYIYNPTMHFPPPQLLLVCTAPAIQHTHLHVC